VTVNVFGALLVPIRRRPKFALAGLIVAALAEHVAAARSAIDRPVMIRALGAFTV
jgi:hypothetical protein